MGSRDKAGGLAPPSAVVNTLVTTEQRNDCNAGRNPGDCPNSSFYGCETRDPGKKKGTARPRPQSVLVADSLFHLDFAGVRFVMGGGVTGPVPEQV